MKKIGIYVHIPFCKKKCEYCDFVSYSNKEFLVEKYVYSLIKSIENYKSKVNKKYYKVNTIYIGGGTPSFINSKYIVMILEKIRESFCVDDNAEITIELNPGTVTEEKLLDYKKAGINRVSVGLQSSKDSLLKMLGRIHTYDEFLNVYDMLKENGFDNINVDLMLGLPMQTIDDIKESMQEVLKLNLNHVSVYSLIVEEGTPLEQKISSGSLELPKEELERKMYYTVKNMLEKNGYVHYEISNFAKKGYESKHNVNCWNQEEYLGFGIASHSYFENKRFSNIENLEEYIENIETENYDKNIVVHEIQSEEAKKKEYMLLGLRKLEGVSISKFEQKFRIHPLFYFRFEISKLEEEGLIEVDLDNIRLTKKGLDFANLVWQEFV